MANDIPPPPPPPVESTDAGAECASGAEAPGKKAWSKPTIRTGDGVLSAESSSGSDPTENSHYINAPS